MSGGWKIYNTGLRDDDTGAIITFEQYYASPGVSDTADVPPPGMTLVAWQIPESEYPTWMAREAAIMGGVGAVAAATFVAAVVRRRPE